MNKFNLPQGLLDSVTNVLKTTPRDNTPLQEKLIKANQSAVKATTDFDKAVSSVVAEGRRKEAERQAKFVESAAKAHKSMGKSIVESLDESMTVMPMGKTRGSSVEDRYKQTIAHAKKMGYNVHHNEHYGDEKSGNSGTPDITVHYQRGDDRAKADPEAIEIHKGGKAAKDATLKSIVKGKSVNEELIIAESAFDEIAARMKNIGNARRMQNMTEQKETIAQMTRTFSASFDQIVEANIAEMSQEVILALAEAKAEIRTQMLHAVNVAAAARVVDESSKIMAFIAVQEALKGKQHKIDANKNGKIDAHDFEVLKSRKARAQGEAVDESAEQVEEGWDDMLKDVKSKMGTQPNGGSGVKKGKRYGGAAQKNDSGEEKEEKSKTNEEVEQIDELSTKMLNKYREAAKADAHKALNKTDPFTSTPAEKKTAMDRMNKRMGGVARAGREVMLRGDTPSGVKEDVTNEGVLAKVKSFAKKAADKALNTLGHGSDDELLDNLRKKSGVDVEKFKKNTAMDVGSLKKRLAKEEVEQVAEVSTKLIGRAVNAAGKKAFAAGEAGDNAGEANKLAQQDRLVARGAAKKKQTMGEGKNMDTPGNSYKHQCAIHVKHSKLGEGKTLYSQHAQPDADGNIAWYDVMFEEGIKRVDTTDLEILVSESHMNHKKK